MKNALFISLFCAALLLAATGFLFEWQNRPVLLEKDVEFVVDRGMTIDQFSSRAAAQGLVTNQNLMIFWLKFRGGYEKFQAGRYLFVGSVTPRAFVEKIERGEVYFKPILSITIPEGFTVKQIAQRLASSGVANFEEILSLSKNRTFMQKVGVSAASSLEGYLYPATYVYFDKLPSASEALSRMVEKFFSSLPKDYLIRLEEKKLSLHEAIILASLIELESFFDEEKAMISEVLWNRLQANMPLGIDAAIIYGIRDYRGDIKTKHLKDASNPYNTRIHAGLPPTPIGSVSLSSLLAVLNPTQEGYFYYVLSGSDSKKHIFTRNLAEHNRYVQEYLKSLKKKTISLSNSQTIKTGVQDE
ncbi:MAG: endolytic transglycosylase MltG [Oligoflexales bacterium]|nr:endolytic transglycosylase MltG [Oligoflexales bacterium]